MWISNLNLTNFRNYRHLNLELLPGPMIFHGDNAQGKTNLLEAIHVLATTRSHRSTLDRDLVNDDAFRDDLPAARLYVEVNKNSGITKVEIAFQAEKQDIITSNTEAANQIRKRIRINDISHRASDLIGQLNTVMFSAHDIELIIGAPSVSRRYLDIFNSQVNLLYLRNLQQYQKVLPQRNRLLKLLQEHRAKPEQLEFWDKELVESGSNIILQRRHSVSELNTLAYYIHHDISLAEENLEIMYVSNIGSKINELDDVASEFRRELEHNRSREIAQGITLFGPHRDNLQFLINGADANAYGSRGQQRSVALSHKLAEAKYMNSQVGESPILLLDDMLSELDQIRRQHLLDTIMPFQQVLITTTDVDRFQSSFLDQSRQFLVKKGSIQ
jgi:DNA replication and repair protein RecF